MTKNLKLYIKKIYAKIMRLHKKETVLNTPLNYMNHDTYKKIYIPCYNQYVPLSSYIPSIFNKDGKKMDLFFLRDKHTAHEPYFMGSKYFLWDRFNLGLSTHFYTHDAMLETMGSPTSKYAWLLESPDITQEGYALFNTHKGIHRDFDTVFTYDQKLLDTLSNAKFSPAGTVWYGCRDNPKTLISDTVYERKDKNISFVCSEKKMTEFHKIRHAFASEFQKLNVGDIFGKFNGGKYVEHKEDTLEKYRYQIVIENGQSDYYFTEKILDCFVSMTVPIYLGANRINDFFNMEGIIVLHLKDINNLEQIIKNCTQEDYKQRLPAIKDNFKKVQEFININDYIYENYFLTGESK